MSYKDYLRSRTSGIPNVVRVRGGDDASLLTLKKRYIASGTMRNSAGALLPSADLFLGQGSRPAISTTKLHGGKVPDASVYAGFRGSVGIDHDSAYLNNYTKTAPCNPIPVRTSNQINSASNNTTCIKTQPKLAGESEGLPLFVDYMSAYNPLNNCLPHRTPNHGVKAMIPLYVPFHVGKQGFHPTYLYNGIGNYTRMQGGVIRRYPGPVDWKHGNPLVGHQFPPAQYRSIYSNYINVRTRAFYNIQ